MLKNGSFDDVKTTKSQILSKSVCKQGYAYEI